MSREIWNADLHVHTNLSFCAPRTTKPDMYLPYCEEEEINILGFSNHIYSPKWLAWRDNSRMFSRGADYSRLILPDLEVMRRQDKVKVLLGAEVEVFRDQEPTLNYEEAKKFDYILLAASHVMNVHSEYEQFDLSTPEKLRNMTVERFMYACSLDYPCPVGICHPLYALCSPWEQEVVDGISDSTLSDCFTAAAKKNISIEIHACLYRGGTKLDETGISPTYLRILSAAKACGCRFHFGADAHAPESFRGVHSKLRMAAERLGITPDDMWDLI